MKNLMLILTMLVLSKPNYAQLHHYAFFSTLFFENNALGAGQLHLLPDSAVIFTVNPGGGMVRDSASVFTYYGNGVLKRIDGSNARGYQTVTEIDSVSRNFSLNIATPAYPWVFFNGNLEFQHQLILLTENEWLLGNNYTDSMLYTGSFEQPTAIHIYRKWLTSPNYVINKQFTNLTYDGNGNVIAYDLSEMNHQNQLVLTQVDSMEWGAGNRNVWDYLELLSGINLGLCGASNFYSYGFVLPLPTRYRIRTAGFSYSATPTILSPNAIRVDYIKRDSSANQTTDEGRLVMELNANEAVFTRFHLNGTGQWLVSSINRTRIDADGLPLLNEFGGTVDSLVYHYDNNVIASIDRYNRASGSSVYTHFRRIEFYRQGFAIGFSEKTPAFIRLRAYPNPVDTRLEVTFPEVEQSAAIQLVNVQGSLLETFELQQGQAVLEIDMTPYPAALYFLRYQSPERFGYTKVIRR